jgi:hypothetical protein
MNTHDDRLRAELAAQGECLRAWIAAHDLRAKQSTEAQAEIERLKSLLDRVHNEMAVSCFGDDADNEYEYRLRADVAKAIGR